MSTIREDASFPAPGLQPGEQILRYLTPSFVDSLVPLTRFLRSVALALLAVGLASIVALFVGTLVHIALGIVLFAGTALVTGAPAAWLLWRRRPRTTRWWVTTDRLVVRRGSQLQTYPVRDVRIVDVDIKNHTLCLDVAGEAVEVGPTNAIAELWGAVLFAAAWDAPAFALQETSAQPDPVFYWVEEVSSTGRCRGVLALRPPALTWLPERDYMSLASAARMVAARAVGVTLHRVQALPPLARFATLMLHAVDPTVLDRECARVAEATGSWSLSPRHLNWTPGADGSVDIEVAGRRYHHPGPVSLELLNAWSSARPDAVNG